ncbi:hypothetical protein AMATHDRAFT_8538 [Amanita thiersii Skay4041]|uniref:Uncharacterized protein n=1 Tax=Amanita thiersii Skay4041 TaxID=703135 RepID=A0A2A9NC88_9AGAR|nr:hypothetical protein AMATHDRAFT_8538 [Amanita thiersii Skay4041]
MITLFSTTSTLALLQIALLAGSVLAAPLDPAKFDNVLINRASGSIGLDPAEKYTNGNVKHQMKHGPCPLQGPPHQPCITRNALDEARKGGFKNDATELEGRDGNKLEARMFGSLMNILRSGVLRSVTTDPGKKAAELSRVSSGSAAIEVEERDEQGEYKKRFSNGASHHVAMGLAKVAPHTSTNGHRLLELEEREIMDADLKTRDWQLDGLD